MGGHTDRRTYKQTDKQTDRQTNGRTMGYTNRQTDGPTDKQDRHTCTYRRTDIQTDRQTNTEIDKGNSIFIYEGCIYALPVSSSMLLAVVIQCDNRLR